jgi:hypothetical protein
MHLPIDSEAAAASLNLYPRRRLELSDQQIDVRFAAVLLHRVPLPVRGCVSRYIATIARGHVF